MTKSAPKVVADIPNNRLYFTISDRLNKKDIEKLYTETRFCVADLSPGFGVINDLTNCSIAALGGMSTFRKITNYLVLNEVGRVVRVVDKNKLVFKQLLNFTSKMAGYKADLYYSLEEAEAAFLKSEKRDSLRFTMHEQRIEYGLDSGKGNGIICDISTSGCAVKAIDKLPILHDKVLLTTNFEKQENMLNELNKQSVVVWVEQSTFGVKFEDMGENDKELLWERLVYESKSVLP